MIRKPHGPPRYNHNREYESNIAQIRVERGLFMWELSEKTKVHINTIMALQNGTLSPVREAGPRIGEAKESAVRIAEVLGVTFADLFPRYACTLDRRKYPDDEIAKISIGFHVEEETDPAAICERNEIMGKIISRIGLVLSPRSIAILVSRSVLGVTLDELSSLYQLSLERIRQIESKAQRKLFHDPSMRALFKEMVSSSSLKTN